MTIAPPDPDRTRGDVEVPDSVAALRPFVDAGVFVASDVQVAAVLARLVPGRSPVELLATAMAARAPRFSHVCLTLADLTRGPTLDVVPADPLPWPSEEEWRTALTGSPLVAAPTSARDEPLRPLVWDADRLYLQRFWCYEVDVAAAIRARGAPLSAAPGQERIEEVLDLVFGPDRSGPDAQRLAVRRGIASGVSCVAGGPGTGKTHTVARLLVADWLVRGRPDDGAGRVALVAPTGKAAARMDDAVRAQLGVLRSTGVLPDDAAPTGVASTIHRLLGAGRRGGYRHDRGNPLPHELVVVDETSMVSLPLMAALIDALRPEARLVLVGDPYQLASIEAGTVMSDLVGPEVDPPVPGPGAGPGPQLSASDPDANVSAPEPAATHAGWPLAGRVTVLRSVHRFRPDSGIAALSRSVQSGDVAGTVDTLRSGSPDLRWVDPADTDAVRDVVATAVDVGVRQVQAALAGDGDAALALATSLKVLAATRRGPLGVAEWTGWLEQGVASRVVGFQPARRWHVGRPVLVTANDPTAHVFNGDTGVVVAGQDGVEVVLDAADARAEGAPLRLAPSRLDQVETWWAMTIHKSQGSEYPTVIVALPPAPSPILTRELLYTACTRARERLVVVADEASLRAAVVRPLARASGLRDRLWPRSDGGSEGTGI